MHIAFKFALRQLAKTPGFTTTAVATLAICLAANLTIFAVIDAILVRSLPFPHSDRIVSVFNAYPGAGVERSSSSLPNYFDRTAAVKAFSSISIYQESSITVGASGSPDRVPISRVSPEFFSTLGVPLAMGQSFTAANLAYGPDQVAVLTDAFWRKYFNADPKVVGKTFFNDGISVSVVGVLPANFHFLSSPAQFYRPSSHDLADRGPTNRHDNNWDMIARLAPGVTLTQAQAQIDAFNTQQMADDPYAGIIKGAKYHTTVLGLHDDHVHAVKPMLVLLQCGVLFLLLIGCVNLVNLLLIRASSRAKEHAVRQALGARRRHIIFDVLLETTLLALGGGLCGLMLGAIGVHLLRSLGTDQLPLGASVEFDGRVAAASFAVTILVGLVLAAPVIWFVLHAKLASGLQLETRGGTVNRGAQRLRHGFIVAQVSLAFVLLSGAGLLSVSLKHVLETSPGFTTENLLTGRISLPWKGYQTDDARLAFIERLVPAIRAIPGVTSAAVNNNLPFTPVSSDGAVSIEGSVQNPSNTIRAHYLAGVTGDYLSLMKIPLLRGRLLEDQDNHRKPAVCVIDQAFAERYWGSADPLGRRLTAPGPTFDKDRAATVVGVVGNVKQSELAENAGHGSVYLPYANLNSISFYLLIRTTLPASAIGPMVQKAILQLDPELPINDLKSMQSRIDESLVTRRSPAILALVFAAAALLLAGIGTYGVLSYAVTQRQREIGVRIALGAQAAQIRNQFLSIGVRLILAGTFFGLIGSWLASRAMQTILFGVPVFHAPTFAATAAILSVIALAACLLPARRATRVDPAIALRAE